MSPRSPRSCRPSPLAAPPNDTRTFATETAIHHGVVRGHVVTAVQILRTRLVEPWTLDALAHEVHLSRSQLVRAFDATTGMSPMAYLRQMRVERMARLLVSTDLTVAAVARTVGWDDSNYASRCFHAVYGMPPTEYRRQQTTPPVA